MGGSAPEFQRHNYRIAINYRTIDIQCREASQHISESNSMYKYLRFIRCESPFLATQVTDQMAGRIYFKICTQAPYKNIFCFIEGIFEFPSRSRVRTPAWNTPKRAKSVITWLLSKNLKKPPMKQNILIRQTYTPNLGQIGPAIWSVTSVGTKKLIHIL